MDQKPNVTCTVCGENDFHLKEGYYYCKECGTKTEQLRAVEVERDNEFEEPKHRTTLKIKTDKSDKPQLTSWECYNYILRGIVQELLDMGAKEELKVVVLQIWAAYLRTMEVAFFSRKYPELPKLGIRFERMDATILYNHALKRRKAKRVSSVTSSTPAGSKREWRKQVKKFNQSQYEESMSQSKGSQSAASQSSFGETSLNSSSSAPSNRAIRLKYSTVARRRLKKKMTVSHLKKHEDDFTRALDCHVVHLKDLHYCDVTMELKMKQLYAIVAVALNLIEDDIQVTDLMRFVAEGHISSSKVEQFFPDNISAHLKESLTMLRFNLKSMEFTVASIREQCSFLCKAVRIRYLKKPDISKMVQRYITELCLPPEIYTLIERLINLYPPKMEWNSQMNIPCYESRAMAYIIFTLKLLFGLDGRKEKQISMSTVKVNRELAKMGLETNEQLFVWQEWVECIEMRKVILCNHNLSICKQFKQVPPRDLYLKQLDDQFTTAEKNLSKDQKKKQENIELVFNNFLKNKVGGEKLSNVAQETKFSPSFTPCHNYFKRIQLDPLIDATIPDFMRVDHSKRSLMPLLQPKRLETIFANNGQKLNVIRIGCTAKLNHTGTFRNPFTCNRCKQSRKVNFNTDEAEWNSKMKEEKVNDTIFKPAMERYCKKSLQNVEKKFFRQAVPVPINMGISQNVPCCNKSTDLFDESDMEPADVCLSAPRRDLGKINIFADISDDEYEIKQEQNQEDSFLQDAAITTLSISNLDCWVLMGKAFELSVAQSVELKSRLPLTFFWLLEICANTLSVEWTELYDQLLVLETFFTHAIEPLNELEDRIIFKKDDEIKDINKVVRHFKACW